MVSGLEVEELEAHESPALELNCLLELRRLLLLFYLSSQNCLLAADVVQHPGSACRRKVGAINTNEAKID